MTTVKEAGLATIDMKLEVIVIPVSDAARAEQFYAIWAGGRTSHRQAQAYSIHPARFRLLGPIRQGPHFGGARLSPENVLDRF